MLQNCIAMETVELYKQNTKEEHWAEREKMQCLDPGLISFSDGTEWKLEKDEGGGFSGGD